MVPTTSKRIMEVMEQKLLLLKEITMSGSQVMVMLY